MTSSIDPVTGRGTGFLPITVTRMLVLAIRFSAAAVRAISSWRFDWSFNEVRLTRTAKVKNGHR